MQGYFHTEVSPGRAEVPGAQCCAAVSVQGQGFVHSVPPPRASPALAEGHSTGHADQCTCRPSVTVDR